jgi:hypothetical protein
MLLPAFCARVSLIWGLLPAAPTRHTRWVYEWKPDTSSPHVASTNMPPSWAMVDGDAFPFAISQNESACVLRNKKQGDWPLINVTQFRAAETTWSSISNRSRFQGMFLTTEFGSEINMAGCAGKRHHDTEREALDHLRWAKKQPGGKGLRDLCVYQCVCGNWCVGRAWRGSKERYAAKPQPQPLPKPLTAGQLRRKADREAREADRQAKYADWHDTLQHVKRMVDKEIARLEALGVPKRTTG